jgi:hypothetical protein
VRSHYLICILHRHGPKQYARILQPQGNTTLLSLPDGTWKYTLETPQGDTWQQADFDDRDWLPMIEKPLNTRSKIYGGNISYLTKDKFDQGAKTLGIDTRSPMVRRVQAQLGKDAPVYIRKTFTLLKNSQ